MTQENRRRAGKARHDAVARAVDQFVSGLVGLLRTVVHQHFAGAMRGARSVRPRPFGRAAALNGLAKTAGQRRTKQQIAALERAVLKVIQANPGIDAKTVAAQLGLRAADLRAPTQALRRRRAIRVAAGRKQGTKYEAA